MISLGELGPSDIAVIREVYDSDNAPEIFEMELERALQVSLRFRDIGVEWPIDQNYPHPKVETKILSFIFV